MGVIELEIETDWVSELMMIDVGCLEIDLFAVDFVGIAEVSIVFFVNLAVLIGAGIHLMVVAFFIVLLYILIQILEFIADSYASPLIFY